MPKGTLLVDYIANPYVSAYTFVSLSIASRHVANNASFHYTISLQFLSAQESTTATRLIYVCFPRFFPSTNQARQPCLFRAALSPFLFVSFRHISFAPNNHHNHPHLTNKQIALHDRFIRHIGASCTTSSLQGILTLSLRLLPYIPIELQRQICNYAFLNDKQTHVAHPLHHHSLGVGHILSSPSSSVRRRHSEDHGYCKQR